MFGTKTINDNSLYMLNDMVENRVIIAKKELSELSPEDTEKRDFLTIK